MYSGSPRTYSPAWDPERAFGAPSRGNTPSSPSQGVRFVFENAPAGGSPHAHSSPSGYGGSPMYSTSGGWRYQVVDGSVPVIKERGDTLVPDFITLMQQANQQSGAAASLRYRPVLGWDELSAKLERPRGLQLEVDVEGGEELGRDADEQEDGVEDVRKKLSRSRMMLAEDEDSSSSDSSSSSDDEEEDDEGEGGEREEEAEEEEREGAVVHVEESSAVRVAADEFNPLSEEAWKEKIIWGDDSLSDDSCESGDESMMEVSAADGGEEGEIPEDHVVEARRQARKRQRDEERRRALTPRELEQDVAKVLNMPVALNEELTSGRWTDLIIWHGRRLRRHGGEPLPPYYGRLILDHNDPSILLTSPELQKVDLKQLGLVSSTDVKPMEVVTRRTVSIPTIEHAECALNHEVTIGDYKHVGLSEEEARQFHRPRLGETSDLRWAIRLPKAGTSKKRAGALETSKPIKNVDQLVAYEGKLVLIEYVEEHPLFLSNPGMATKLVNLFRLSRDDLNREKVAGTANGQIAAKAMDGNKRISRETLAVNSRKVDMERTHASVPELSEGHTVVLYPDDNSPFLGQIEDRLLQRALFNNMFKAPAFAHKPRSTDFLLVQTPASKVHDPVDMMEPYSIREMPSTIYLSGQMEPLMEVFSPDSQKFREFIPTLIRAGVVARFLEKRQDSGDGMSPDGNGNRRRDGMGGNEIQAKLGFAEFEYVFDSLWPLLASSKEGLRHMIHQELTKVAKQVEDGYWALTSKGVHWENYMRQITPEEVCAFQCMCASVQRLRDEGLSVIGNVASFLPQRLQPILEHNLKEQLSNRNDRWERMKTSLLVASKERQGDAQEVIAWCRNKKDEVEEQIKVGKFIFSELQLCPWNLSHFYHIIQEERQFGGMFKLQGLGDPSGIGEGFSFLPRVTYQREAGKTFKEVYPTLPPELQNIIKNVPPFRMPVPMLNQIISWCLDPDKPRRIEYARRLTLAGYETDPEVLKKLTRVPKKQRVQALLNVDSGELTAGAGIQDYHIQCNRIWDKQVNALSDESGHFDDEEVELDIDDTPVLEANPPPMDSNAGGEEDPNAIIEDLNQMAKRRAEREAEERRLMGLGLGPMGGPGGPPREWMRPAKVVKRLIKEMDENGCETFRVEFRFDAKEVERVERLRAEEYERQRKAHRIKMRRERGENIVSLPTQAANKRNRAMAQGGGEAMDDDDDDDDGGDLTFSVSKLIGKVQKHKENEIQRKKQKEKEIREKFHKKPAARQKRQVKPHVVLNSSLDDVMRKLRATREAKPYVKVRDAEVDLERMCRKSDATRYRSRQELLDDLAIVIQEGVQRHEGDQTLQAYAVHLKVLMEAFMEEEFRGKPVEQWEAALRKETSKGKKKKATTTASGRGTPLPQPQQQDGGMAVAGGGMAGPSSYGGAYQPMMMMGGGGGAAAATPMQQDGGNESSDGEEEIVHMSTV